MMIFMSLRIVPRPLNAGLRERQRIGQGRTETTWRERVK